ncbi:hypothetical protein QR680_018774 [Steinernema hermaphroditum]|uniref:Fungal lipase-type domain-containing protein n=1 Tax=Steinernema hermaphroditum TaxID=289476 RepID=A0AA39HL44_9BILA|nr:hypothetical protein QR680_018774 [Steinernema hermaphroditum]
MWWRLLVFVSGCLTATAQTYGVYNESFAIQMLNMVAASYASNYSSMTQCLEKTFPKRRWKIWRNQSVPCDSRGGICHGFSAISFFDMKILISFRGTENFDQLLEEINSGIADNMVLYNNVQGQGSVIRYFYEAVEEIYGSLDVANLIMSYPSFDIWVTGHSIGGALASLTALKIAMVEGHGEQIKVVTFGEPRIGDFHLAYTLRSFLPNLFRVVHGSDPIPHGPPCGDADVFCKSGCPLEEAKPFHAPQEVWYSKLTKEMPNGHYRLCDNQPGGGEDPTCSNSVDCIKSLQAAEMHFNYFNHFIPDYGKAGCVDFAAGHSISASLVAVCALITLWKH